MVLILDQPVIKLMHVSLNYNSYSVLSGVTMELTVSCLVVWLDLVVSGYHGTYCKLSCFLVRPCCQGLPWNVL